MVSRSSQMSNKKNLVVLGCIGDEILPCYMGIIKGHYKDPVIKQPGLDRVRVG